MGWRLWTASLGAAALLAAAPAVADDDPRFCPTRPSLGGSSCTTEPGQLHVEYSLADWQRDDQPDQRDDRIVAADLLARLGIGKNTEVQFGWTAFGHDRTRDKATGVVGTADGTGDVTFALRQHLTGHEGQNFSAGVQGFVTAPTGRYPVGAGTWGAGILVPVQYDLTKTLAIAFTGETDAKPNQAGDGRHVAYSGIGTLRYKLTSTVSTYAEVSIERDDDPAGHATLAQLAFSTAWRPTKTLQLDLLTIAGLTHTSPDFRLVFGGAILFR